MTRAWLLPPRLRSSAHAHLFVSFPAPPVPCGLHSLLRYCIVWLCCTVLPSVATVALASYKGERAMIDCVQEYEERSKAKARKQRQMREEAAAAAAAAGALTLQQ